MTTRQIDILINIQQRGNVDGLAGKLKGLEGAGIAGGKGVGVAGKAIGALGAAAGAFSLAAVTAEVVKFASQSVKAFTEFDRGVREVFTLMPNVTEAARTDVERSVLAMSASIGRSTAEITTGLYESLSANVPEANVFQFLEAASQAAKGGVTELNVVVDGFTSVLNGYGMEVSEVTRVSDILFQTVKFGKVRFEELASNLSIVVPVAASLGVPLEEVGSLLAVITAQGTPASVAATQIRSALLDLSKGGGKAATAFKELTGVSFQEFLAGGGTVQGALQILADEADRTGVNLTDFFGRIEGGQAALQTTGKAAQLYADISREVTNATGSTASAVKEFDGSLDESNRITAAATEQLKILVGEGLAPAKVAFNEIVASIANGGSAVLNMGHNTATIMTEIADSTQGPIAESRELAKAFNAASEAIDEAGALGVFMGSISDDLQTQLQGVALSTIEVERGFTGVEEQSNAVFRALQAVYGSSVTMENGLIFLDGALIGNATHLYELEEATQAAETAQKEAADTANRLANQQRYTTENHVAEVQATYELSDAYSELQERQRQVASLGADVGNAAAGVTDDLEDSTDATIEQSTAWQDALSAAAAYHDALNAVESAMGLEGSSAGARLEITRLQAEADREAAEALTAHNQVMTGYFNAALNAEAGAGLFTQSLANVGTKTVFVSDLTGEQAARLGALRTEYENITGQLDAYRIGTEGILLSEEDRAEKMAELSEQAAILEAAMGPLVEVGGEYVESTTQATFNTQAVSSALYDAAAAAGVGVEGLALLGLTLGIVSEEQAEAALKAALLQASLDGIAASFAAGDLTAQGAAEAMRGAITEIENLDISLDPATNSVDGLTTANQNLALAMDEPIGRLDSLAEKLGLLPGETNTTVNVNTAAAEAQLSSLEARLAQLGSGGQPGTASGGNQSSPDLPGRASGGPVTTGQAYNVAERGTELYQSPNHAALLTGGTFTPPENGMIVPAGQTSNHFNNNPTYNINGAADLGTLQYAYMMQSRRRRL